VRRREEDPGEPLTEGCAIVSDFRAAFEPKDVQDSG
jgi:hypothetical protein